MTSQLLSWMCTVSLKAVGKEDVLLRWLAEQSDEIARESVASSSIGSGPVKSDDEYVLAVCGTRVCAVVCGCVWLCAWLCICVWGLCSVTSPCCRTLPRVVSVLDAVLVTACALCLVISTATACRASGSSVNCK